MARNDILARFYHHPVKDQSGLYKDAIYVELRIKGDRNTTVSRPKNIEDEVDYPNAWKHFLSTTTDTSRGTPLGALPYITQSALLNLKEMSVFTVEDLAEVSDEDLELLDVDQVARTRARAYLAAMNVESDQALDLAQEQPKRRGRPRKVQA